MVERAFQVTVYTPSLSERSETVILFGSEGSTRTSPTSTMRLFESTTDIELRSGSSGSLKNSSTCTGGCSNAAFADGLERTNKACAETDVAIPAQYSRTTRTYLRMCLFSFTWLISAACEGPSSPAPRQSAPPAG